MNKINIQLLVLILNIYISTKCNKFAIALNTNTNNDGLNQTKPKVNENGDRILSRKVFPTATNPLMVKTNKTETYKVATEGSGVANITISIDKSTVNGTTQKNDLPLHTPAQHSVATNVTVNVESPATPGKEDHSKAVVSGVVSSTSAPAPLTNATTTTKLPSTTTTTTTSSTTTTTTTTTTTSTSPTITTTTTQKPKKPTITYSVEDMPEIANIPHPSTNHKVSEQLPKVSVDEPEQPIAQPSQEFDHGLYRNHRDYIIPIVSIIFVVPIVMGTAIIAYRRFRDFWSTRHYRRMDFLVDGMYND